MKLDSSIGACSRATGLQHPTSGGTAATCAFASGEEVLEELFLCGKPPRISVFQTDGGGQEAPAFACGAGHNGVLEFAHGNLCCHNKLRCGVRGDL